MTKAEAQEFLKGLDAEQEQGGKQFGPEVN
jgi:hypothetical protein